MINPLLGVPVGAELEISQEQTVFIGSGSASLKVHFIFYSPMKNSCFLMFLLCDDDLCSQEVVSSNRRRVALDSGLHSRYDITFLSPHPLSFNVFIYS